MPQIPDTVFLMATGVLLIFFLIAMAKWSRKQREISGWGTLESRYPMKDKFKGEWQINCPLRLVGVMGYHGVDIGFDSSHLYLRPTQYGDIVNKAVQIPWSAIEKASITGDITKFLVTPDKNIEISLECAALRNLEQIARIASLD